MADFVVRQVMQLDGICLNLGLDSINGICDKLCDERSERGGNGGGNNFSSVVKINTLLGFLHPKISLKFIRKYMTL